MTIPAPTRVPADGISSKKKAPTPKRMVDPTAEEAMAAADAAQIEEMTGGAVEQITLDKHSDGSNYSEFDEKMREWYPSTLVSILSSICTNHSTGSRRAHREQVRRLACSVWEEDAGIGVAAVCCAVLTVCKSFCLLCAARLCNVMPAQN